MPSHTNFITTTVTPIAKELENLLLQETEIRNIVLSSKKVDFCLFLGNAPIENTAIADIMERLHKSVGNPKAFSEWANYCQVRQEAMELGLGQILDMYLQPKELSVPLHLADAYEWVFYRSLVKSFFTDFPQFRQFSGLNRGIIKKCGNS